MANDNTAVFIGDGNNYLVPSRSSPGLLYTVSFDVGSDRSRTYACECLGWRTTQNCRHIRAVLDFVAAHDAVEYSVGRCTAQSDTGHRCENPTIADLLYCTIHRDPETQCHYRTATGARCRREGLPGQTYCENHLEGTGPAPQCEAITQAGNRCKNPPMGNTPYCSRHDPSIPRPASQRPRRRSQTVRAPVDRCPALNLRGQRCQQNQLEGEDFCLWHLYARDEGWNWWEWEDKSAADAFRLQMLQEAQSIAPRSLEVHDDAQMMLDDATQRYIVVPHQLDTAQPATPPTRNEPIGTPRVRSHANVGKSKTVAVLLALFLGGLGIHQFYLGHTGRGIAMLVLLVLFFPAALVWALVDFFRFLSLSTDDFDRRYDRY